MAMGGGWLDKYANAALQQQQLAQERMRQQGFQYDPHAQQQYQNQMQTWRSAGADPSQNHYLLGSPPVSPNERFQRHQQMQQEMSAPPAQAQGRDWRERYINAATALHQGNYTQAGAELNVNPGLLMAGEAALPALVHRAGMRNAEMTMRPAQQQNPRVMQQQPIPFNPELEQAPKTQPLSTALHLAEKSTTRIPRSNDSTTKVTGPVNDATEVVGPSGTQIVGDKISAAKSRKPLSGKDYAKAAARINTQRTGTSGEENYKGGIHVDHNPHTENVGPKPRELNTRAKGVEVKDAKGKVIRVEYPEQRKLNQPHPDQAAVKAIRENARKGGNGQPTKEQVKSVTKAADDARESQAPRKPSHYDKQMKKIDTAFGSKSKVREYQERSKDPGNYDRRQLDSKARADKKITREETEKRSPKANKNFIPKDVSEMSPQERASMLRRETSGQYRLNNRTTDRILKEKNIRKPDPPKPSNQSNEYLMRVDSFNKRNRGAVENKFIELHGVDKLNELFPDPYRQLPFGATAKGKGKK